jgi:RHS repeat-associated protein
MSSGRAADQPRAEAVGRSGTGQKQHGAVGDVGHDIKGTIDGTGPDGATAYAYDTLNRLATLTPPAAFTTGAAATSFGFAYDAPSRRTLMTRLNGVARNYTYDNLSHLLSVLHQLSGSTVDGTVYTLDADGNRTAKQDDLAGVTSNYTYDKIYELTQVTQGANTTESYSYDPVGNRHSSLGLSPYNVNTSNELTSTPSTSYTYDNNGNTTSKTNSTGTTNYAWDYENRLTTVTLPGQGGTVTFKYDPFGRRVYKSSSSGTTIYAYDGDNVVETTDQSGAILSRFAQGQNIDEPLAESTSSGTGYYEQDGLGSVTSLTNSSAQVAQTYTYDSFGNTTNSSGSLTNPFRYTGREVDTETNLYYYRARYCDPGSGRFLSEDPVRFGFGPLVHNHRSGLTYHLLTASALRGRSADFYSYVSNGPANANDPTGLWQVTVGGGYGPGVLLTFGNNNGHWNVGLDVGSAVGLFGSLDPDDDLDCDCGFNAHAEGDLGTLIPELGDDSGIGGDINVNQDNGPSYGISLDNPNLPEGFQQWTWDPAGPQPHPTFGVGAGAFAGAGYTWCF